MDLRGKSAIVTGAGGGIGKATAARLARSGASVACVDIDPEAAEAAAKAVSRQGGKVIALNLDVSTEEGNQRMVDDTVAAFGHVDALHANAAIQRMGQISESSVEDWQALFQVNLLGVALGTRSILPQLVKQGGGSIVITASLLGLVGDPDMPAYGAMKGGLTALCKSLAAAHGADNVRVNTICPGDVLTPMLEDFFQNQPDPDAARKRIIDAYPLRRMALPEDIANLVAFLVSDEASYLTGIDIPIDGGLLSRIY